MLLLMFVSVQGQDNNPLTPDANDTNAPTAGPAGDQQFIRDFCSCTMLVESFPRKEHEYRCLQTSEVNKLWPKDTCTYTEHPSVCTPGPEPPLYREFATCVGQIDELQRQQASLIGDPQYDNLRCCLGGQTDATRRSCAQYQCLDQMLLSLPFACQTAFFVKKDSECRMNSTSSNLTDCHAENCSVALLRFDSITMYGLLIAAAVSTFLCAILGFEYIKRKRQRMLEWAKLEGRVLGGEGGEDDLMDILAQKERRERVWYYLSKQGKVIGPLQEEAMRLRKVAGLFDDGLMVRCNDSEWRSLSKFYANPEVEAFEAKTRPMLPQRRR